MSYLPLRIISKPIRLIAVRGTSTRSRASTRSTRFATKFVDDADYPSGRSIAGSGVALLFCDEPQRYDGTEYE
ncbi:hypothetical protein AWB78_04030 [Caballeronia calidae]|uniref:Uncharacterized protein n=1 Tax=Caballeronia calidae TaxID=1777139 RepID=A0A158CJN6_9BURK|nr:hypothetical protein AWB78_04030 [Caballeronia calidae]